MNPSRLLILRNGSLGDTIAALPAFRMIAEAFPNAHRTVLTAQPMGSRAVQLESVLTGTGYVHDFLSYDGTAAPYQKYLQVRSHLRAVRPEITIYLFEPKQGLTTWRDAIFLVLCGAGWVRGLPFSKELRHNRWLPELVQFENETDRLMRVLSGSIGLDVPPLSGDWLLLSAQEHATAHRLLKGWPGQSRFIAASLGSRVPLKDWGESNWTQLLAQVAHQNPALGLVLLGTNEDHGQAVRVACVWPGPVLNLCGQTAPRISAAVMSSAALFVGNDGGSMHLAAAVGTPCVAVFTARSPKGIWFPYGNQHRVHYREVPCGGCLLDQCTVQKRICITSITVAEVLASVSALLNDSVASKLVQDSVISDP